MEPLPRLDMLALCAAFPSLQGKPGVTPWNAEDLDRWTQTPAPTTGSLAAARFVLSVWNPSTEWKAGPFDLHGALQSWDQPHREAFLRWASDPWWP